MKLISDWLSNVEQTYSVNPVIFVILYFGTFIPCWYFVFKIIGAIRKKSLDKVILFSIIELFLIALPYLYVMIWGRNLSIWIYLVLVLIAVMSTFSVARNVFKNIENKSQFLWDTCSFAYRNAVEYSLPHQKMFEQVYNILNLRKGSRVLDAGCGSGDFEKHTFKKNFDASIEGIDFSYQMIMSAKKKCKDQRIHFQQANLDRPLPFSDKYFDAIVCIQVLFALPRLEFTLKEFNRVLKPGGRLVIVEPKPDANMGRVIIANFKEINNMKGVRRLIAYLNFLYRFPFGAIVLLFNLIMDNWERQDYYKFYSIKELQKKIRSAEFQILSISDTLANQDNLILAKK